MKEKRRYRKYDERFKQEVLDQLQSGRSAKDIAEGLGITASLIYRWKAQRTQGTSGQEDEQLKELRQRVKMLERDNEILKKALTIFTQRS